jgi:hypothetical protein
LDDVHQHLEALLLRHLNFVDEVRDGLRRSRSRPVAKPGRTEAADASQRFLLNGRWLLGKGRPIDTDLLDEAPRGCGDNGNAHECDYEQDREASLNEKSAGFNLAHGEYFRTFPLHRPIAASTIFYFHSLQSYGSDCNWNLEAIGRSLAGNRRFGR